MRKTIVSTPGLATRVADALPPAGIDVAAVAEVQLTSESPDHPIENAFDGRPETRWEAEGDGTQSITIAFDAPTPVRHLVLGVDEDEVARTQEVELATSRDGGASWTSVARQQYVFSPPGTTSERERWELDGAPITHVRLAIRPTLGGEPARAKVTTLGLE